MKLLQRLAPVCALVLALFVASVPAHAAPASQAGPQSWTVLVGAEADIQKTDTGSAGAWQFMRFYPDTITVNEGDSIVWKLNSTEFHTVSFLKPGQKEPDFLVPEGGNSQRVLLNSEAFYPAGGPTYDGTTYTNSGLMSRDIPQTPQQYKLTFSKAGTYEYYCIVHPMMKAKVIVQAQGSSYPKTQAQVDADAKAQMAADLKAVDQIRAQATQAPPTKPGPNGTTIHQVALGYSTDVADYMRFTPGNLTIHAGDTVQWLAGNGGTPHTVTFPSGGQEPALILPEPQPNGPPKLVFNPQVVNPAGSDTYSGTGYFNSGVIFGSQDPTPGPRTYALKFDKPGTYDYICILHDNMAMEGQVTVLAAGATAGSAPGTAPGTLPVTGGSMAFWAVLALGLALAIAGVGMRSQKVRN